MMMINGFSKRSGCCGGESVKKRKAPAIPIIRFCFAMMLVFMVEQSVIAQRIEATDREIGRSRDDLSRIRKIDLDEGGLCRIKLNKETDQTLKIGSTKTIGLHEVSIISITEDACILRVVEKNSKTLDFHIDSQHVRQDRSRGIKRYQSEDKTFLLETREDERGVAVIMTWPSGRKEITRHMKEGEKHVLSDGSIIALLEIAPHKLIKLGIALNIRQGTYARPVDPRFSRRESQSRVVRAAQGGEQHGKFATQAQNRIL